MTAIAANAHAVNAYNVNEKWRDPETGEEWLHFLVLCLDFAAFKAMPEVLHCDGKDFRRMGFNTDSGRVAYKQLDNALVGRPSPTRSRRS